MIAVQSWTVTNMQQIGQTFLFLFRHLRKGFFHSFCPNVLFTAIHCLFYVLLALFHIIRFLVTAFRITPGPPLGFKAH